MSILFIARAILKDLNKSGCFHLNWRLGMDSLDWENSQHFAISPLVSPQYKYSNFYFILMMCHYLDLGKCIWLVLQQGKFASANQKHFSDLRSDRSWVWNFCAHSSDVILLRNQWWWGNVSAVFSSYSFLCCWKLVTWCL